MCWSLKLPTHSLPILKLVVVLAQKPHVVYGLMSHKHVCIHIEFHLFGCGLRLISMGKYIEPLDNNTTGAYQALKVGEGACDSVFSQYNSKIQT